MSRSSSSRVEKKNSRYFSDIITLTHKTLKEMNERIGKPLAMTAMNREFEQGGERKRLYECGEEQHPVNALETFMRDLRDLRYREDLAELDDEGLELTQAQGSPSADHTSQQQQTMTAKSKKSPLQQLADAKQLKKVALFLLHCYVRVFMMQSKKDLAEPSTINTVSMIADSDMLRRAWQSEMDEEMKAFAAERGFKVRTKILEDSKSVLNKLFTSAEVEKLSDRWKEIYSGNISFNHDDNSKKDGPKKSRVSEAVERYDTSSSASASESSEKEEEDDEEEDLQELFEKSHSPRSRTNKPGSTKARNRKRAREESLHSTEDKSSPVQKTPIKKDTQPWPQTGGKKIGCVTVTRDGRLIYTNRIDAPQYEEDSHYDSPLPPTRDPKQRRANTKSSTTTITAATTTATSIKPRDSGPDAQKSISQRVASSAQNLAAFAASSSSSSSSKNTDKVTLTMTREQWATIKRSIYDLMEVLSAIDKS